MFLSVSFPVFAGPSPKKWAFQCRECAYSFEAWAFGPRQHHSHWAPNESGHYCTAWKVVKDKFWWNQLEINYFFLWSFWENWGEVYSLGQRDVHNRHINDHSHSCIRDQCWKSFPSPFFCHSTCLPRWVWNPRPYRIWPTRPGPRRVSFPPQPHGVSLRSPRAESEASKKLWRSPGFVHLLVCPTKCLPSYPKISGEISFIFIFALILICFFLAQDLYVQTLRLTSAPPVVAF